MVAVRTLEHFVAGERQPYRLCVVDEEVEVDNPDFYQYLFNALNGQSDSHIDDHGASKISRKQTKSWSR